MHLRMHVLVWTLVFVYSKYMSRSYMYRNVYSVYVKGPHRQIHSACVCECIFSYIH